MKDILDKIRKLTPKALLTANRREKRIILLAVLVIAAILIHQLIISPVMAKRRLLNRQIEAQSQTMQEILTLKSEYEQNKNLAKISERKIARRKKGFTLFSFLDSLAGTVGLKERIAYMKPSTTTTEDGRTKMSIVETKIQAITMKQLTDYIYRIETSPNMVRIKKLSITAAGREAGTIDAVLLVETFEA